MDHPGMVLEWGLLFGMAWQLEELLQVYYEEVEEEVHWRGWQALMLLRCLHAFTTTRG